VRNLILHQTIENWVRKKMNLLYLTDPHFSAYNPLSRKDNYMQTCFLKLEEVREISKREKCEALLISGDFFHLKSWMKNPYLLTNKLIEYFTSLRIPIFGIYGDHDLSDRNAINLDRQPLGTLVRGAGIELIDKGGMVTLGDGIYVTGSPKTDLYESDITNYVPEEITGAKYHIHMVHGDLYPSKPVYEPYTLYESLISSPANLTLRGHIHRNDGIVQVGKTSIVGIGSLTRGTFNTDSINRRPSVAIIDTTNDSVKIIELKSAPEARDIFDFDKKEAIEKAEQEIDRLSDLIKFESKNQELQGPEAVIEEVRKLKGIDEKVKNKALQLLETAREFV
jgi:DNA repair protein SbcD/Mre11